MKVSLRYVNLTEQVLSSFSKATGKEVGEYSLYCSKYQDVSDRRQWDEKDDYHWYECDRILERSSGRRKEEHRTLVLDCSLTKCSSITSNKLKLTAGFEPLLALMYTLVRHVGSS